MDRGFVTYMVTVPIFPRVVTYMVTVPIFPPFFR